MNYIDLHCDTLSELMKNPTFHLEDAPLQVNLEQLTEGNCLLQCFAMFVYLKNTKNPFKYCIEMIDRYYEELKLYPNQIAPVFTYEDILKNHQQGKISSLLTIEEGGVTESNLAFVRTLYRLGVRMICLNWNFINGVGHPNFILNDHPNFKIPNEKDGLTEYGIQMVKQMNSLGIIVDVSHLSDKGFYDCIKYSTKPIVASHSNARTICSHVRNLTDDMILCLAKNGGVMGMNFCASFLDNDEEKGRDTISCLVRHITYIKNLAGIDVLAIGSDFDGIDPNISLRRASLMPKLFEALRAHSFTEEEIEKLAYKNFLRVAKENFS
ncbi:MAG: dipeptidase [Anaeroplasmataceae bacterium]|nr:dipeptidase [Anaeroplasmataceae bacterium]